MKQLLIVICVFTIMAGVWLAVMENVLKHDGYAGRAIVAVGFVLQSVLTLLLLRQNGPSALRALVLCGAAALVWTGSSALNNLLHAQHFEGFVLVISVALILQGVVTWMAMTPRLLERGHRHHA